MLTRVFDEGAYADRAFTGEAERAQVDARERALAMHLAFGTVQRRRTLDAALEEIAGRPVQRLERRLAHVLQLGVFQILFADGIPPHAAVSESVELARRDDRRARHRASSTPCCGASPAEGPELVRGAARGRRPRRPRCATRCPTGSPSCGSTPTARSGRGRCARPPTAPPALSLWPNPLRDGDAAVEAWLREAGARGRRATTPPGVLRVEGPLDVAGSHAFASGAVVPIARAAVLVAQRVGAQARHARARPLRGAGRQDRRAGGERRRT